MKRILFLVMIFAVAVSCKEKDNTDSDKSNIQGSANASVDCDNHPLIIQMRDQNQDEIVAWIKLNGKQICDGENGELIECIEPLHKIDSKPKFDSLANLHPDNATGIKFYTKTWQDVENFISDIQCYDEYVGFTFENNNLGFKKVQLFTTDETCYSKPFLSSIGKKLALSHRDQFCFTKTTEDGIDKFIFEVKRYLPNNTFQSFYYDFSRNPPFTSIYKK